MKTCEMQERLDDFADGLLSPPAAREVQRHLESCAGCTAELEALRRIQGETGELSRTLEPPHDLWPGIEAAIRATSRTARPSGPHIAWRVALPAMAAGLLVLLTAWVTARMVAPGPAPVAVPAGATALESFRTAELQYREATEDLLGVLAQRRDELSPETVGIVEDNLRIIDQAIREAWAALENDPAGMDSGRLITSLHRKKIALLEQAVSLPAQS